MKTTKHSRAFPLLAVAACLASSAYGAGAPAELQEQSPTSWEQRAFLRDYTLQPLFVAAEPGERLEVGVNVGGVPQVLDLRPRSVRSANFRVIVANGSVMQEVPAPPSRTYVGMVRGFPESVVSASVLEGQLWARIEYADRSQVWQIQPLSDFEVGVDPTLHVTHSSLDILPSDYGCGVTDSAPPKPIGPARPGQSAGGSCYFITETAFDTDVEFWQQNGSSVPNTIADIENVMNNLNVIFARDVAIVHAITTIIVRTGDPNSDPYQLTSCGGVISEFQTEWNNNQTGVKRDIAHMMTGKNLDGNVIGCAFVGVICSQTAGYGISQSRYTGNFTLRVSLTAHELGHNWSACHCNNDCPAGQCNIMCSVNGGCGSPTLFAPQSIGDITDHRDSRSCLDDSGTYVDLAATTPHYGTQEDPFLTVAEGVNCAAVPGPSDVFIQAGTYSESTLVISKHVILHALGGNVVIN